MLHIITELILLVSTDSKKKQLKCIFLHDNIQQFKWKKQAYGMID